VNEIKSSDFEEYLLFSKNGIINLKFVIMFTCCPTHWIFHFSSTKKIFLSSDEKSPERFEEEKKIRNYYALQKKTLDKEIHKKSSLMKKLSNIETLLEALAYAPGGPEALKAEKEFKKLSGSLEEPKDI
jgi:hypothetical protein